jgi:D-aspartate ligase
MKRERIHIVFGVEHYNPLGMIRSLGESGIHPIYIAIPGRVAVASCSKYIAKCHRVKDYMEGCKLLLEKYGNYPSDNLPIVMTTDDEIVGYMDEHYEDFAGKFIFFNAGRSGKVTEYMDKYNILTLAKENGFQILPSKAVPRGVIPDDVPYPVITKSIAPNVGGWKSDVFICKNEEELKVAYEKIQSPTVLVQQYLDKKDELALEGFSIAHGEETFISIASNYPYTIDGYYSPYHYVKNFKDDDMYKAICRMMKQIEFEGIFEIEFLVDKNNTLYFSEINFRCATWNYASTCVGMNLPTLWCRAMITGTMPIDAHTEVPEGYTAMVEPIDYQKRVIERGYDRKEWYQDFINAGCKYYFNEEDMTPFFIMLENNEKLR